MFIMHAESRHFWPVIAFVPWVILGIGCLLYAARQTLRGSLHAGVALSAVALLAVTRVVMADPGGAELHGCQVATTEEARVLADRLYERGEYQRAGECYQAAGDLTHANLAFLQAAGPRSADTARDLKAQRDTAKSLFTGVAHAFKGNH